MALTDIQKIKLTIGDSDPALPFLTDEEYQYFLDKNNGNINRASKDAGKSILFKLSSMIRERASELEYYGSDYFKQYKIALDMFLKDAQFGDVASAMPYAGGISRNDIEGNLSTIDNYTVPVENPVPTEYVGYDVNNNSPFKSSNTPRTDAFDL